MPEYLSVFSPNAGKCGKNADQDNSEYRHFLRSAVLFGTYVLLDRSLRVSQLSLYVSKLNSVFSSNAGKCGKNADQNNSE